MIIGVPKEIKDQEYRVAITPAGVAALAARGHQVLIEKGAGLGSGISDEDFRGVGARLLPSAREVWREAQLIYKVKEPLAPEYEYLRPEQIIFTFLHLAPLPELTRKLIEAKVIAIAYETIETDNGELPLLTPMSEVAGRMAVTIGAYYLARSQGGSGVLMSGVPGVPPAHVVIIGGGTVGSHGARVAAGMGAQVTLLELDHHKIRHLEEVLPKNVTVISSSPLELQAALKGADLVIGAVLVAGARAPRIVSRSLLRLMKPGSVVVDVAVDQGGCFETTRPTTHSQPIYFEEGVLHYCVANMPGAYARTSTYALTNETLPYAIKIADRGWKDAARQYPEIARGLNIVQGHITCKPVAEAQGLVYTPWEQIK